MLLLLILLLLILLLLLPACVARVSRVSDSLLPPSPRLNVSIARAQTL